MTNLLLAGVIQITGPYDVGKTSLALECGANPANTTFVDSDIKGRATVEQIQSTGLNFARYVDFVKECKGSSLLKIHELGTNLIKSLPDNQDAIIWDTWTRYAATFKAYIEANQSKFRASNEWPKMGTMKGATQWAEAQLYEAEILNLLQEKARLVILVTHLKDHYQGNQKSGARIPASSRTLDRVPIMRLWLMHTPGNPVPTALMLKRPNVKRYVDDVGLRTTNILPRKVTPREGDESLWDTMRWYYDNPIGNRKPEAHETPNAKELAILNGILTKEQRETLRWSLKIAAAELEETEAAELQADRDNLKGKVQTLLDEDNKPGKIARKLGIKVPQVKAIIADLKE